MTEQIVMGTVTAAVGLLGTMFTGYMAFKMAQLKQQAERDAEHTRQVAIRLEASTAERDVKLSHIQSTGEKTLKHVNDQFLIQLRLYKESMRVIADYRKAPGDIEKAEAADRMYREHEEMQKKAEAAAKATDVVVASEMNASAKEIKESILSIGDTIREVGGKPAITPTPPPPPPSTPPAAPLTEAQVQQVIAAIGEAKKPS